MNSECTIGFVGGCAITQQTIPKEKRFFEIARAKLKADLSTEASFLFSVYSQFSELEASAEKIVARQNVDVLIIHLRPQPFLILSKLIIKQKNKNNSAAFFINPLIYSKTAHPSLDKSTPVFNQLALKPKFMEANVLAGRLFGLNKKAAKQIMSILKTIQSKCKQKNIQLVILGIPPQPMTKYGNINCKELNSSLIEECRKEGIEYVDSFAKLNSINCFDIDGLHLSEKGHAYLGDILAGGIKHLTVLNLIKIREYQ